MSIVNKRTKTEAVQPPSKDFVQMTPEQIVEQLRILRQHIPMYGPLDRDALKAMARVAAVSRPFVDASINAVGASPAVETALGATADDMRGDVSEVVRWSSVEDELTKVLQGVRAGNLTRRYHLGLAALQTYSISQQLARSSDHADLLPHIEAMRRLNMFGARLRRKRIEAPAPAAAE
ncbi:MAG TPA: hypothetical protein VGF48_11785 [Thermoanaerobaculia bacterium]|jgi:hypothetical protein